jgi:hypothetical protein
MQKWEYKRITARFYEDPNAYVDDIDDTHLKHVINLDDYLKELGSQG